jgi:uncharacterized protein YeaO (DUF488 family)
MTFRLKRVYEPASEDDGYRILVDRLWPRGISKDDARLDLWLRRIAPSDELREWYGHEVDKWPEFRERYRAELESHRDLIGLLHDIEHHRGLVTLLFGAKDEAHNEANVLIEVLKESDKS